MLCSSAATFSVGTLVAAEEPLTTNYFKLFKERSSTSLRDMILDISTNCSKLSLSFESSSIT